MFFYLNAMKRVLRLTALVSAVLLCLPLHGQYLDQYTHTANHTPSVESFQMTRYGDLTGPFADGDGTDLRIHH